MLCVQYSFACRSPPRVEDRLTTAPCVDDCFADDVPSSNPRKFARPNLSRRKFAWINLSRDESLLGQTSRDAKVRLDKPCAVASLIAWSLPCGDSNSKIVPRFAFQPLCLEARHRFSLPSRGATDVTYGWPTGRMHHPTLCSALRSHGAGVPLI